MSLRHFLLLLILACAALPASAQDSFRKVLFLGNSITKHGPKADIDWSGNWGMAASAEAHDYVHLVTQGLATKTGTAPAWPTIPATKAWPPSPTRCWTRCERNRNTLFS